MQNDYIVNQETMVLLPYYGENGVLCTEVKELYHSEKVTKSPLEIITASCEFYTGSFEGLKKVSGNVLGGRQMLPLSLSVMLGMYWLPSQSPYNHSCIWFAHEHIRNTLPYKNMNTKVKFANHEELILPESHKAFKRKVHQTAQLRLELERRHRH